MRRFNGNVTQRRSYNYDKHGNVTKEAAEVEGTSTSFTYNKVNELTSAGSRSIFGAFSAAARCEELMT